MVGLLYSRTDERTAAQLKDDCISTNGLSSVIRLLPLHSGDVDAGMLYGGPADVVVHEIVDSTLLGEAVLPALRDAFARRLAKYRTPTIVMSSMFSPKRGATVRLFTL